MDEIKRMWVNQPSTLQERHALHGSRVLAVREHGSTWRVRFTDGRPSVSRQLPREALSEGRPKKIGLEAVK